MSFVDDSPQEVRIRHGEMEAHLFNTLLNPIDTGERDMKYTETWEPDENDGTYLVITGCRGYIIAECDSEKDRDAIIKEHNNFDDMVDFVRLVESWFDPQQVSGQSDKSVLCSARDILDKLEEK